MVLSLFSLLLLMPFAQAFSVGAPNPTWISPGNNTLTWTTDANDPTFFNVFAVAANASILNGAYGILNTVPSANGTAELVLPPVPLSVPYSIVFTSVTNNTDILATSPLFTIVANASQLSATSQIAGSQTGSLSPSASLTHSGSASASASATRAGTSAGSLTIGGRSVWAAAGAAVLMGLTVLV